MRKSEKSRRPSSVVFDFLGVRGPARDCIAAGLNKPETRSIVGPYLFPSLSESRDFGTLIFVLTSVRVCPFSASRTLQTVAPKIKDVVKRAT